MPETTPTPTVVLNPDELRYMFMQREYTPEDVTALLASHAELYAILLDHFTNNREGWKRPWKQWHDRAKKAMGLDG